jgi:hypothetical protein
MSGVAMKGYYSVWIEDKVRTFQNNLRDGLSNMIGWWIQQYNQANPPQPTQTVKYDYACRYNSQATGTATVDDVALSATLSAYVAQNTLTWIPDLLV